MVWWTLMLVACGVGEGGACGSTDQCRGELFCDGPNEGQVCGIPGLDECADSAGCPGDEMCHTVFDPCGVDGYGRFCAIGCPVTPCEEGFACGQGICVPLPCTDGFDCAPHQTCDPAAAEARGSGLGWRHGCIDVTCEDDDGCADGESCVNGVCQSGPGTCRLDEPVP